MILKTKIANNDDTEFPEFANRSTTREIEGNSMTGLFVSDFTAKVHRSKRISFDMMSRVPNLNPVKTVTFFI